MYEQYLSMSAVPAGVILRRILQKEHLSQKELAKKLTVYPQRISDLINGKRKFTPESSFRLEKALGISTLGYFCQIQKNHDIYCYNGNEERKYTPDLSKINKALFWDSKIEKINWIRSAYHIVKRTFEYGNEIEITEIIKFYGREKTAAILDSIPVTDAWKSNDRKKNRQIFGI